MNGASFLIWAVAAVASPQRFSMQAESPFTQYTAAVAADLLIIGFLVSVILIGAFTVLNIGMMSKRDEDRVGGRTPSDVGILKETNWPEEHEQRRVLPAEESPPPGTEPDESTKKAA